MEAPIPLRKIYYQIYQSILPTIRDNKEAQAITYIIIEHYLHHTKSSIALDMSVKMTQELNCEIQTAIEKIKNNEPIQYVIGQAHFMGRNFIVTQNVLIPRQETELLVNQIIQDNKPNNKLEILDIGTGSGCIAITLQKELNCKLEAIDLSTSALEIAQRNAKILKAQINFIKKDILQQILQANTYYDIIVSNPPYVLELEKKSINLNVLKYEPHLAIFVKNEDPLIFYKKITDIAVTNLKNKGRLYLEINELFGEAIKQILEKKSFIEVKIHKDLNNKDRYISAQINKA
jgi:release factor glutamine methyltransferase